MKRGGKIYYFSDSTTYVLINDLEFESDRTWTPLPEFKGRLEGNKKTISNLKINMPATNEVGLFSKITDATVQDLKLTNVNVNGYKSVGRISRRRIGLQYNKCRSRWNNNKRNFCLWRISRKS